METLRRNYQLKYKENIEEYQEEMIIYNIREIKKALFVYFTENNLSKFNHLDQFVYALRNIDHRNFIDKTMTFYVDKTVDFRIVLSLKKFRVSRSYLCLDYRELLRKTSRGIFNQIRDEFMSK